MSIKEHDLLKEYREDTISSFNESFGNVDNNDPYFGIMPKLLSMIVKNETLEDLLKEKGWFKTTIYLLQNYPLTTILQNKKDIKIYTTKTL